jgi:hypothetical protein
MSRNQLKTISRDLGVRNCATFHVQAATHWVRLSLALPRVPCSKRSYLPVLVLGDPTPLQKSHPAAAKFPS